MPPNHTHFRLHGRTAVVTSPLASGYSSINKQRCFCVKPHAIRHSKSSKNNAARPVGLLARRDSGIDQKMGNQYAQCACLMLLLSLPINESSPISKVL